MKRFFALQLGILAMTTWIGTAHAQYAPQPYPPQPYPPQPYPAQPYPPQPYPPPAYYAPPQLPPRLPYGEGQPIPAGYRVSTHARRGLVIGGAVTFGVLYVLSIIAADTANSDGHKDDNLKSLYIPAIGPFIAGAGSDGSKSIFYLDGFGQVAGLAMFIGGFAFPQTELVRNDVASVRVLPMVGQGKSGLTVNVAF